jgi:uncharacterized membrane protein
MLLCKHREAVAGTTIALGRSMESRAQLLGHPVHQMLVAFPIGAFGVSVTSDALHAWRDQRKYEDAATLALDFALVSASVAAPFGLIDWLAIPSRTRAKRVGLWHALGNAALIGTFATSRWLRSRGDKRRAHWLSGAGLLLSVVTAWLGGELVNRHGIGVHRHMGLDAPNSLVSGR